ncbi:MAG: tripartite tricarboxylate transporter substrate binding protein [Alphaproteobacteria bacterium]|nr:tripartite tricarboxylate transporter substrate binding protein [Alphaproteobacteria bacterium]
MTISRRRALSTLALVPAGLAMPGIVRAQNAPAAGVPRYPVPHVTLITHSSPGGGGDVMGREMIKHLPQIMGVTMAVENVSGAAGARAMTRIATGPTDGSVVYITTPTHVNTAIMSRPPHGLEHLQALVNIFFDPQYLMVRNESPHKTAAEMIAAARANPGRQRWGATLPSALERQLVEQVKRAASINVTAVTHDGGGDMLINVLNGSLECGIGELQEVLGQIEARRLRLIGVFAPQRVPATPDVPTMREQGVNIVAEKFRGLATARNFSPAAIAAWEAAIPKLVEVPAFKDWITKSALVNAFMKHEEAKAFEARFVASQREFFREMGITTRG